MLCVHCFLFFQVTRSKNSNFGQQIQNSPTLIFVMNRLKSVLTCRFFIQCYKSRVLRTASWKFVSTRPFQVNSAVFLHHGSPITEFFLLSWSAILHHGRILGTWAVITSNGKLYKYLKSLSNSFKRALIFLPPKWMQNWWDSRLTSHQYLMKYKSSILTDMNFWLSKWCFLTSQVVVQGGYGS